MIINNGGKPAAEVARLEAKGQANKEFATESQVSVGLLEFKPTPENLQALGKTVWEVLQRSSSRKPYIEIKGTKLYCYECVVHGT